MTTVLGGNVKTAGSSSIVAQSTVDGYRAIRMKYNEGITFHAYQGSVTAGDVVGNERMRITPAGNVGIGTAGPSMRLSVLNVIDTNPSALFYGSSFSGGRSNDIGSGSIRLGMQSGYYGVLDYSAEASTVMSFDNSYDSTAAVMRFRMRTLGTPVTAITVLGTGNVGIGTTNPTHKLSVNGTVRAKEVIVDTGWSDYVFDDNYRLTPLSEIESRIKADKHLPGIPSAQEVAERGIGVGEMQSKLLAKIEELTLHQIAQEKAISALRAENTSLRHEVESLKQTSNH